MSSILMVIAAGLIALVPALCRAESSRPTTTVDIRPSIVRLDDGNKYTGALEFKVTAEYELRRGSEEFAWRRSFRGEFKAEGLVTGDKERNSRPLRAEVIAGGSLNMSGPTISELGPNPGEEIVMQQAFDYGRLSAGLNAGYETDQALDNRSATAGGELAYVMTRHEAWRALIPSASAQYEWVSVARSDLQRTAQVTDNGYQRYRAAASWKLPLGDHLGGPLKPAQLHIDARYYKDLQRPAAIEQAGLDESRYVAGALSYTFASPVPLGYMSGVYVKVSRGRIPPAVDKSMDVYLGLILFEK